MLGIWVFTLEPICSWREPAERCSFRMGELVPFTGLSVWRQNARIVTKLSEIHRKISMVIKLAILDFFGPPPVRYGKRWMNGSRVSAQCLPTFNEINRGSCWQSRFGLYTSVPNVFLDLNITPTEL